MTTLAGYDIAGVNGSGIITTALKGAFVICKATEGITFDDNLHDTFVAKVRTAGKLVGHYHYARPTNDVVTETDHFIRVAKAQTGDVMALDFEPYYLTSGKTSAQIAAAAASWPEWIIAFCARVKAKTGASCWVYLNDWFANLVLTAATAEQDAILRTIPIWKAGRNNAYVTDPSVGPGDLHGWPVCTCWQWKGTTIDEDIFYGDANVWRALGVGGEGVDMPLSNDDVAKVWTTDNVPAPKDWPDYDTNPTWQAVSYLREILAAARRADAKATALGTQVTALSAALTAVAQAQDVDAEEIKAIVQTAVDTALADVQITLDTKPNV
jgi:hypothetical protein